MRTYRVSLDPSMGAQHHPQLGVLKPGKGQRVRLADVDAQALRAGGYTVTEDQRPAPAPLVRLRGARRQDAADYEAIIQVTIPGFALEAVGPLGVREQGVVDAFTIEVPLTATKEEQEAHAIRDLRRVVGPHLLTLLEKVDDRVGEGFPRWAARRGAVRDFRRYHGRSPSGRPPGRSNIPDKAAKAALIARERASGKRDTEIFHAHARELFGEEAPRLRWTSATRKRFARLAKS